MEAAVVGLAAQAIERMNLSLRRDGAGVGHHGPDSGIARIAVGESGQTHPQRATVAREEHDEEPDLEAAAGPLRAVGELGWDHSCTKNRSSVRLGKNASAICWLTGGTTKSRMLSVC